MQVGVARLLIIFLMAIFIQQGTNSIRAYNFRQQLDFNKTFAEKHDVTALFGMEVRENKTEYNNRKYYNYDPALLTYDLIDERVLSNTYTGVLGNYVSFNKNDISNIYELVNRFCFFFMGMQLTRMMVNIW